MKDRMPAPHSHEYFVDLVQRSPKIPRSEWTEKENAKHPSHLQFGNNFIGLFEGRLKKEQGIPESEFGYYVLIDNMLIKHPVEWNRFLEKNKELVKNIDEKLVGTAVYTDILFHFRDLLLEGRKTGNYTVADEFEKLGIEEVGVYAFRLLNPLLEKAAEKMEEEGINPKEFFG